MTLSGKCPHKSSRLQWFDWEGKRFVDVWAQSDMGSLCCFTTSSPIFSKLVCRPLYFKHVSAFYPSKNALLARKASKGDKDYIFAFETNRFGMDISRVDNCRVDFQIFKCSSKQSYINWMTHLDSIPSLEETKKYLCSSFPDAMAHRLDSHEHRIPKSKSFSVKPGEKRGSWRRASVVERKHSPSPDYIQRTCVSRTVAHTKEKVAPHTPSDRSLKSPKETSFAVNKAPPCFIRTLSDGQPKRSSSNPRRSSPHRQGNVPPGAYSNSCCLLLEAELKEKSETYRKVEKCLYNRIEDLEVRLREKEALCAELRQRCEEAGEEALREKFAAEKKAWVACMEEEVKKQWEGVQASVREKDKLIAQQRARIEELERMAVMTMASPQSAKSDVDSYIKSQLTPEKQEKLLELDAQLDFILEEANELSNSCFNETAVECIDIDVSTEPHNTSTPIPVRY
eukprot:TRINITY_DN5671_c0_g1_i1.p2 TRINITY_DN5671_c0_g1~~TRINITY_DN5671_c0_g1_i1.p2  ORF type:complete len:453 (+),score=157.99 TRINITY_DN5671_c0_g1_i1:1079-2437(+)